MGRNDKIAADKLGRGLTVPIMHFDELAYINLIEISLPVALSSGSAAREEAASVNQPYGNVYTTTAGKINSRDGGYARFLPAVPFGTNVLDRRPTGWSSCGLASSGVKPLIYGAFNHRQLGKTDQWLFQKLRESASEGEIADRDYLNIWTTGNEGSPLNTEEKEAVKSSEREIDYMDISEEGYTIRWYIPEHEIESRMASSKFVAGNDPSDALGAENDATGLVIIDAYTHDVICTGRYNETNLSRFSKWLAKLLIRFPNITFVPERKSSGMAILDTMIIHLTVEGVDPFKRIYNLIVDDPNKYRPNGRKSNVR